MQLGPIANWGLNIDKKTIEVDTENLKQIKKVFMLLEIFVLILEN